MKGFDDRPPPTPRNTTHARRKRFEGPWTWNGKNRKSIRRAKSITNSRHRTKQRKRRSAFELWNACSTVFGVFGPSTRIRIRRVFRNSFSRTVNGRPPCSPDLGSADFFLFPKLKFKMKTTFFNGIPAIRAACTKAIPVVKYPKAFEPYNRFMLCISRGGVYVGDWYE